LPSPPPITGSEPNLPSSITRAACSRGSSASTVITGTDITRETGMDLSSFSTVTVPICRNVSGSKR